MPGLILMRLCASPFRFKSLNLNKRQMQRGFIKLSKRILISYLIGFVAFSSIAGLFLFNPFGTKETQAAWFNDNWAYRKTITFTSSAAATNTIIKLDIDTTDAPDKIQADCGDIRFTDPSGKILRYYLDSTGGACDTSSTDFYIQLPTLVNGSNLIYMYYGNPSVSNGTETSKLSPYVQSRTRVGTSSTASENVTFDTTPSTGNTIIVAMAINTASTNMATNSVSDNKGNTYTRIVIQKSGTGADNNGIGLYYASNITSSATFTVTCDPTGSAFITCAAHEYTGILQSSPQDQSNSKGQDGGSTNVDTNTVTTSFDNELYFAAMTHNGGANDAMTPTGSNYNQREESENTSFMPINTVDKVAAAGTYDSTWTVANGTFTKASAIASFKPGTLTPTPTVGSEEKGTSPALYWKFDDGEGTVAQDSTTNNRDGSTGISTWKTEDLCVSGKCLYFDGTAAGSSAGAGGGADQTIDNNLLSGLGFHYLYTHKEGIVWTSSTTGYVFFLTNEPNNTEAPIYYSKTTDSGQTWGTEVQFTTTNASKIAIWYDKETSGDNGTKIHVVYNDVDNDDLLYKSLNTSGDSISSAVTIDASFVGINGATQGDYFAGGFVTITKARGGNLYVFGSSPPSSQAVFYRSSDAGSNWTSRTSPYEGDVNDLLQLMPSGDTDSNDIACVFLDEDTGGVGTAAQLSFKLYDDSGNSWGNETTIDSTLQDLALGSGDWPDAFWGFDVAIRHSDNKAIISYWNYENNAAADLKVAELTLTAAGAASSAKTDVLTNTTGSGEASVFIDNNSNDIYTGYIRGGTWDSLTDVYYKKSTDGASSWGTQTKVNNTQDDIRILSTTSGVQNGQSGRFAPVWPNDDTQSLLSNYSNSVTITPVSAVKLASTISGVRSVAFWVKPNAFTSTTPLVDINGTAKITTNSSGVITASGFTTIYVNGQVGTTISANTWNYVVATHGSDISASAVKVGTVGTNYLVGFADEVKLYTSEITAAQVKANYISRGNPEGVAQVLGANTQNMPAALSNGLVGYWKLDESSGNAADSSGNSLTLTNNNTTAYAAGKFGNSASFTAASLMYLSTATAISGVKTVSFWTNNASTTDEYINLIASTAYITSSSGTVSATGFTAPTIYVNGVINGTLTASTWNQVVITSETGINATAFEVGRGNGSYNNGKIDGVRLYNRTLSNSDVSQLYNWAPGPVGYWKLDEKTGTSAFDNSGNSNDLTWTNSPTSATGKYGGGISLAASDQQLTRADDSDFDFGTGSSFTYGAWIKHTTASALQMIIDKYDATAGNGGFKMYMESDGDLTCGIDDDETTFPEDSATSTAATYDDNAWHYISCVKDGTAGLYLYIDGVRIASDTSISSTGDFANADPLYIGIAEDGAANDWVGQIDEPKIYNYARTPAQVLEDMNAGHPAPGSPVGSAVAYWKLDEGYSTAAHDSNSSTAGAEDLTLSNTAAWTNSGKFTKGWSGDGSRWMSRADDDDLDFAAAEDFTISLWFKSSSTTNPTSGTTEYLVSKLRSSATPEPGYAILEDGFGLGLICFGIDDDATLDFGDAICSSADLYDTNWHYIAATKTGTSRIDLYVDGVFNTSKTTLTETGTLANGRTFYLGDQDGVDNGNELNGTLDEVKIFRSALTADQVKLDYNRGASQQLGSLTSGTGNTDSNNAATQEYCVPGDGTTCTSPFGRWNFEEKTGTTANDTSGNGYNGTLTGTLPTWTTGKVGTGLTFSGSGNSRVTINSSASVKNLTAYTAEAWVKLSTLSGTETIYGESTNAAGTARLQLFADPAASKCAGGKFGVSFRSLDADSIQNLCATTAPVANTWYHMTFVFNSTTDIHRIYINGIQENTSTFAASTVSNTAPADGIAIGAFPSLTAFLIGTADQVKIYNYERTPAQIAWDYNRGGPVAHWKMDECQGTTINDSAGNSLTGTLTLGASGTTSAGTCTTSGSWFNGVSGKRNYSLDFDGTDDYVTVADNDKLDISSSFTLSTWINPDSLPASSTVGWVISKTGDPDLDTAGTQANYEIMLDQGIFGSGQGISVAFEDSAHNDYVGTYRTTLTTGQWYLLTGVFDDSANTLTLYINGQPVTTTSTVNGTPGSITGTPATNANALQLAESNNAGPFSAEDRIDGKMDDARVYNYPLTAIQIKTLYNEGVSRYGPATGAP